MSDIIVNMHGALQKVRKEDGSYEIIFPITRARDVYVDVDKKIRLDHVLTDLARSSPEGSRESIIDDFSTLLTHLSNLLPKPLSFNNFTLLDGDDPAQFATTVENNGIDIKKTLVTPVGVSQYQPKKISVKDTHDLSSHVKLKVLVTNNALDSMVVWEDMTDVYVNGGFYTFDNNAKEASNNWAISLRYIIEKISQTDKARIDDVVISFT